MNCKIPCRYNINPSLFHHHYSLLLPLVFSVITYTMSIVIDMAALDALAGLAIVTGSDGSISAFDPHADPISRPIFIDNKDQDVDAHPLYCSICCDVSYKPVITPCQHIFCFDCIKESLLTSECCPNDRRSLDRIGLRGIPALHEYIYSRTMVQCPRCETWEGQLQHYNKHASGCTPASYVQELEGKVNGLTGQVILLQSALRSHHASLVRDAEALVTMAVAAERERLKNENQALELRNKSTELSFDRSYGYGQHNMLELTNIISQNLLNKPNGIDSTRIYNCLNRCYEGSRRSEYNIKTKANMLIATSLASNWFSHNQRLKILA